MTAEGVVEFLRTTHYRNPRTRRAGVPPSVILVSDVRVTLDDGPFDWCVFPRTSWPRVELIRDGCEGHRVRVTFTPSRTDAPFCRALRATVVCLDPEEHVLAALAAMGGPP